VLLFLAISAVGRNQMALSDAWMVGLFIGLNCLLFLVGVWSANYTCTLTGISDPSRVVIDEVSGQLISFIPIATQPSLRGLIAGFLLFRLFDILKPYPIRRLEQLHGGLGVMADDALAGVYAAVLLGIARLAGIV
jgi:phosphatidylglycerophosphatase A